MLIVKEKKVAQIAKDILKSLFIIVQEWTEKFKRTLNQLLKEVNQIVEIRVQDHYQHKLSIMVKIGQQVNKVRIKSQAYLIKFGRKGLNMALSLEQRMNIKT